MKRTIELIKIMNTLDSLGYYKEADNLAVLVKVAASPYHPAAMDELPIESRMIPWSSQEQDYQEYEKNFYELFYKHRLPTYRTLPGSEEVGVDGMMHGPDSVPGPAVIDQGNPISSPSMNGNLQDYEWGNIMDDENSPDRYKNLTPKR